MVKDWGYSSARAAAYLLQAHSGLRDEIDNATIERATAMFERINTLLPTNGAPAAAGKVNGNAPHALSSTR